MMPKAVALALFLTLADVAFAAAPRGPAEAEDVTAILRRQTQELVDAVTAGDSTVWDRYMDAAATYTDEAGVLNTKRDIVAGTKPLPQGITGQLTLVDFKVHTHGATAIATYVIDETETYFGQTIYAKYRNTDTWHHTTPGWRLLAVQSIALRSDPPAVTLSKEKIAEYAGAYSLTPEITYTIRVDGDSLIGQRSGHPPQPLRAELPDLLFVPGQPRLRKVFQRGPDGHITGFVERRETWDVAWKRMTTR
jgi:hypothetical protein